MKSLILQVVVQWGPIKAKKIAKALHGGESRVTRKDVNQILYANKDLFVVNERFEWSAKS